MELMPVCLQVPASTSLRCASMEALPHPHENKEAEHPGGSGMGLQQALAGLHLDEPATAPRQAAGTATPGAQADATAQADAVVHLFETEPGDHAETPLEAYEHIEPLLARLAT